MYYHHHRIAIKIYDLGNNEQKTSHVKNNSYLCRRKTESIMGKVIIITGAYERLPCAGGAVSRKAD